MLAYLIDKNTKTIVKLVDFNLITENEKNIYKTNYLVYNLINNIDPTTKFVKAKYENDTWVEGATQDEITAWNNKYKTTEKQPTTQEQINAQLMQEIAQQKIVNTQLMQEIATLKGVNANV